MMGWGVRCNVAAKMAVQSYYALSMDAWSPSVPQKQGWLDVSLTLSQHHLIVYMNSLHTWVYYKHGCMHHLIAHVCAMLGGLTSSGTMLTWNPLLNTMEAASGSHYSAKQNTCQ